MKYMKIFELMSSQSRTLLETVLEENFMKGPKQEICIAIRGIEATGASGDHGTNPTD